LAKSQTRIEYKSAAIKRDKTRLAGWAIQIETLGGLGRTLSCQFVFMPIQFTGKSLRCKAPRILVGSPGNKHKTPTKCGHLIYTLAALNGILISMEVVKSPEK